MEVTIRPALPTDLPAMMEIKRDAGVAAWQHFLRPDLIETLPFPLRWEAAVESPDLRTGVLVAELDGRVVGFAITRPSGDEDALSGTGELDGFYTDPGAWGAGAGRALLAAATEALRDAGFGDATLWTATLNHRPRRIYEIAGWLVDGTERHRSFDGVEFTEARYRIPLREGA
jgi:GNAT superfamily N-acetyltransferase